ncbi:uncharacterized protein K02A2.6-like [Helicoverpa zea]|uniref:uncharacterized protein K02A2.6-like n=1 Tax=Helicoverpa zea TaxID=7113 RepID=UPI001F579C77|nr:uncharacterized protein K02A2.6-like [Helicoverpa zea]
MRSTNAISTIQVFRSIFARFGLPAQLVTDNGPPFSSQEFKQYCENNCIKHTTSAPYRPQGNGAAENAVKTVKKAIKRALYENEDVNAALSKFLFQYRNCEHATTGVSPAVALQGRRLRSRLDVLRPDVAAVVRAKQERQVARNAGTDRHFNVGDAVLARNYSARGEKWTEATVVKKTGPVSYTVDIGKGLEWRRHADQIIPKNRYSLSRMSVSGVEQEPHPQKVVEMGAEGDVFEDASSGDGEAGEAPVVTGQEPTPQTQSPPGAAPVSPEPNLAPSPAPPGASARAVRAYHRGKRSGRSLLN